MTQNTILLFDIDGTLISTGGAGRTAFISAFEAETGATNAYDGFSFAGRTDRGIVRAGLRGAGLDESDDMIDRVIDHYIELLEPNVANSPEYVVYPGVHEAVQAVSQASSAIGLGTGNIELIRAGAERGASALGQPLTQCNVIVIGDTIRDVTAAHAIGGRCVGVGTGGAGEDVFESAGADWYFESLAHPDAIPHLVQLAAM